jgi:hypothetical protein
MRSSTFPNPSLFPLEYFTTKGDDKFRLLLCYFVPGLGGYSFSIFFKAFAKFF